jgi:hypothetical protein
MTPTWYSWLGPGRYAGPFTREELIELARVRR